MTQPTRYLNFDLMITCSGGHYRAFVVDAPGGEANILFNLPAQQLDLPSLLRCQGSRRGIHSPAAVAVVDTTPEAVGSQLYEAVFQSAVRDVLMASQREAEALDAGLRLRLRFSEDAGELAGLPWELLYDASHERFLALSERQPIVRYLSLPRPRPALVTKPPLSILTILSSPTGLEPLDLDGEWQVLCDAVAPLTRDGKVVLERLATATPTALQQRLMGEPVHVLHFVGHGVFDVESSQGLLVMADEENSPRFIGAREVATLLSNHSSLRLIYLNACEGALGDASNVFAGLAQRLVQQGAPAAIAMQAEISDKASIELARTFYTALATGRPVDAALAQARVTLAGASSMEWATPVLFSRAPDNRLFDIRDVLPTPDCPYPGMRPFSEAQASLFFGRSEEIEEAVNHLFHHPFLAVIGPSGSGKSSLIYAGVLPALRKSQRFGAGDWEIKIMRPSDSRTQENKADPLQTLETLLGCPVEQVGAHSFARKTLLFVDQFEEIFTLAEDEEAARFCTVLHDLVGRPNLFILLTARADFYPELMAMGALWQTVKANRQELTPLGDDDLWAAIVQPAAQVGVSVDEALAVALIDDAIGEAGVLPLVQETLVLLWEKVESRQLKRAAYQSMTDGGRHGIQVAIDRRANIVYNNLAGAAQPIARRIFLRLVHFGQGRADTRRQQTVAELRASGDDATLFDQTLATLVDSRLLTTSGEEGDPNRRVDISHEALIGGWSLLQRWISEKREAEGDRRRLEEKATEWIRLGQSGGLLDEYELQEAEVWLCSDFSRELGYSQKLLDLIAASTAQLVQSEMEKARAERTRQRSRLVAGALVLALLVVVLVGWFWWQARVSEARAVADAQRAATSEAGAVIAQRTAEAATEQEAVQRQIAEDAQSQAESQAELATHAKATAVAAKAETERLARSLRAEQLTVYGLNTLETHPQRALLLGVEGLRIQNDISETISTQAQSNMYKLLQQSIGYVLTGYTEPVSAVAFSPDGQWLATGSEDTTARLWQMNSLEAPPVILRGHNEVVTAVAFSPDGQWLATGSDDTTVRLWQMKNLEGPPVVLREKDQAEVNTVAFSPDGQWIATGSTDSNIRLWHMNDLEASPVTLIGHEIWIRSIAFSPDGYWLATASYDFTVRLWQMNHLDEPPTTIIDGYEEALASVAFSPDSNWLATGSDDSTVRLWQMNQLDEPPVVLFGHKKAVNSVAFSPDGNWLATGSDDSTVRLWQMNQLDEPPTILSGYEEAVNSVAFSPDGQWLATGTDDSNSRLWRVNAPRNALIVLDCAKDSVVESVAFSPDGNWLASGATDNTVSLWNARNFQAEPKILVGHEAWVVAVTFSPDSQWLASGSIDDTVRLWNILDLRSAPTILNGPEDLTRQHPGINAIAFSPDGQWLAAGFVDNSIRLWNMDGLDRPTFELTDHTKSIWSLMFSPDGRWLASGSMDGTVRLWDMSDTRFTPTVETTLDHGAPVLAVTFSPDGHWLATATGQPSAEVNSENERTIWIWDTSTLQSVPAAVSLKGYTGSVWNIVFSPDSQWLATVSKDKMVRVWFMRDLYGTPILISGHTDGVLGVAFDPDGQWLATGAEDGTVRLWPRQTTDLVSLACQSAGRNLTIEEWQQYF